MEFNSGVYAGRNINSMFNLFLAAVTCRSEWTDALSRTTLIFYSFIRGTCSLNFSRKAIIEVLLVVSACISRGPELNYSLIAPRTEIF